MTAEVPLQAPETDTAQSTGPRSHPQEVWEAQRTAITEKYRIQDLPLDQVMAAMAREHNFHAT
jgi:Clr5 domain